MFPLTSRNRFARIATLAVFVFCFSLAQLLAQIDTTKIPVPANYFGMHEMDSSAWPTASFGAYAKGSRVTWSYIEQTKGVYDWTKLDAYVNNAQSHGQSFYYTSLYVPPWAAKDPATCSTPANDVVPRCTSSVTNIQDWDNFLTALINRYKGRITMYELWNEPDVATFTGTVAEMQTLTQHFHDKVRLLDPKALIASPSAIGSSYMDTYWSTGGVKDVDVIAIHGYPDVRHNDVAESIGGFKTSPLKKKMTTYGLAGKPMWDTEASWGNQTRSITDPDLQAAFIVRHFLLHWANGVSRYYWYAWDNSLWGTLTDSTGKPNKPGLAYAQVYNWMLGTTMPSGCSMGTGTLYHATYTCVLTRPPATYQGLAVWNTDGPTTYTASSIYKTYRDLDGVRRTVPANHVVSIGTKPILLEN